MAENYLKKSNHARHFIWISASLISLGLLALVVMQVDWSESYEMILGASWAFLVLAIILLICEGVASALRLWLFAAKKPCLSEALKANAWYVLLLVILPARLGEVAAIVVLEKYLKQSRGAAAMSIIAQRLYDVIVLSLIFLIALMGLGDFLDKNIAALSAIILIMFTGFVLLRLDMFLTIAAICLGKQSKGVFRKIKRLVLQARIYNRHNLKAKDIPAALLLTSLKWASNLGALVFLFMAINLGLDMYENVAIAAAYNFLAVIPLQTIGGIGVGEAGLALLLIGAGLSKSIAAGASLMIRFVILLFPFIFWVMVMGGLKLKEKIGI